MEYSIKVRLHQGRTGFFGPGPAALLEQVDRGSSLHQAAADLNMSYSKAWRILKLAEQQAGFPLLRPRRGGAGGGGSTLTPRARQLLGQYRRFEQELRRYGDRLFRECFRDDGR